jgi:hypothetical protein
MIWGRTKQWGQAATAIYDHIRSLEGFAERSGARLVRTTLPECVHGRVSGDLITLRSGVSPEQELLSLVHELVPWLAHRDACPGLYCTVFEYEADAVEALVMTRQGMERPGLDLIDFDRPTDGSAVGVGYASELGEQSYPWCARPGDRTSALSVATPRPRRGSAR